MIGHSHCPACAADGDVEPIASSADLPTPKAQLKKAELEARCEHAAQGCAFQHAIGLKGEAIFAHLTRDCVFAVVACPLRCGEMMRRGEVDHHRQHTCSERMVPCELGCTEADYTSAVEEAASSSACQLLGKRGPSSCDSSLQKRLKLEAGHVACVAGGPSAASSSRHLIRVSEVRTHAVVCPARSVTCQCQGEYKFRDKKQHDSSDEHREWIITDLQRQNRILQRENQKLKSSSAASVPIAASAAAAAASSSSPARQTRSRARRSPVAAAASGADNVSMSDIDDPIVIDDSPLKQPVRPDEKDDDDASHEEESEDESEDEPYQPSDDESPPSPRPPPRGPAPATVPFEDFKLLSTHPIMWHKGEIVVYAYGDHVRLWFNLEDVVEDLGFEDLLPSSKSPETIKKRLRTPNGLIEYYHSQADKKEAGFTNLPSQFEFGLDVLTVRDAPRHDFATFATVQLVDTLLDLRHLDQVTDKSPANTRTKYAQKLADANRIKGIIQFLKNDDLEGVFMSGKPLPARYTVQSN